MKTKQLFLLLIALIFVLASCSVKNKDPIIVFSDNQSEYSIVVSKEASDSALTLAEEISALSGNRISVLTDGSEAIRKDKEIIIGNVSSPLINECWQELKAVQSQYEYHYLICEKNGKIIILADNDSGYEYAINRIRDVYFQNGSLIIPSGCFDLQIVTLQEYYASAYYLNQLLSEKDGNRYEDEQNQLENEMNRYEDKDTLNTMTVKEAIEYYKNLASSFRTEDFGTYNSEAFVSAMKYESPDVYPEESHPRVLFTPNSIETVRQNTENAVNKEAYSKYMTYSDVPGDGKFRTLTDNSTNNLDYTITEYIEAKAFRYAMTGEKIYGYQAIYCIKNAILTINIPEGTLADSTRAWGHIMYIAGCVYDWCYDLMTEDDKAQIINGCVTRLGPNMEIVRYDGATNIVPTAQGSVYGHGAESQLLRDWLTFAIACYSEAPEIYEFVGGRLFDEYSKAQNYFYASNSHWEGSAYGLDRLMFSLVGDTIINRMTDGKYSLFENMEEVAITFLHYIRPDNQALRIGDVYGENVKTYNLNGYYRTAFLAGNLYKNSSLKSFSYQQMNYDRNLSYVMYLAINDPTVSWVDTTKLSLTRLNKYPYTSLIAKNAQNDINAFMVYMTMPEAYGASHAHMDLGSFQIYYKGILASNSGKYSSWGDYHHMSYSMQTVSSNSLLIYNPNLEGTVSPENKNMVYSGGQSIAGNRATRPNTFEEVLNTNVKPYCISLGAANVEKDGVYLYSYLAGDMTAAYDEETVDEVTRYMFAVATNDAKCPLVFVVYDRITSDDASYRKSALIHVQEEPTLTSDGFIIITNTKGDNNGKLVVQNVMEDVEYTIIGGEGKQFWLSDALGNANVDTTVVDGSVAEYGWGRVEISPKEADLTNSMLTVMYVTDATNNSAPIKAKDVSTETLAGSVMMNKAIFFPKNDKLLAEEATLTATGTGSIEYFVCGISAGEWTIYNGDTVVKTITVEEGTNLLTFTASAGTYTIKPAK